MAETGEKLSDKEVEPYMEKIIESVTLDYLTMTGFKLKTRTVHLVMGADKK